MVLIISAQLGQGHLLVPASHMELMVPIEVLRFYSFLCKLSDNLMDADDDLAGLDAATAVQRTNDIDCRQPSNLMLPPPPPCTHQRFGRSQPTAGLSGGAAAEEPEYMDVEELVGGVCGLSERDSSLNGSDSEVEGDEKRQRTEATEMPVPLK
jgi:hypothetical protein